MIVKIITRIQLVGGQATSQRPKPRSFLTARRSLCDMIGRSSVRSEIIAANSKPERCESRSETEGFRVR